MRLDAVKEAVLKKIKPSRQEERDVREFADRILSAARKVTGLECALVGSLGKFTWLRGDYDIDLFLMFSQDVSREKLEEHGLDFGKKIAAGLKGRWQIKYAEHPYVHASVGGFDVDIVPCYKIASGEKIRSAVDRSPLHLEYVLKSLKESQQDEVRLLKQFCKGAGVYGSDAKHMGFSGYICELLVLKYGSFEKAVEAAAGWHMPHVISFGGSPGKEDFRGQALVIVDPVDSSRNAAANVSDRNFVVFVSASQNFLKKPGTEYFFGKKKKPLSRKEAGMLQGRGTAFVAISMKKPEIIDDILYPQLRKALKRTETLLRQNGFYIIRSLESVQKGGIYLLFELESCTLPKIKKMVGPPVFSRRHVKEFLSKYSDPEYGPYIENGRWVIEKKRKFTDAGSFLKNIVTTDMVSCGIPENVAKTMKNSKIVSGNFWEFVRRKKELSAFLKEEYLSRISGGLF